MADDLKDRARINVNARHEVRDWNEALGVDEDQLRTAVAAVGSGAG